MQRLARIFKNIREASGLTGAEVEAATGIHYSGISRIERAQRIIALKEAEVLLELYNAPKTVRNELLGLVSVHHAPNPEARYLEEEKLIKFIIQNSNSYKCVSTCTIPTALQTPEYRMQLLGTSQDSANFMQLSRYLLQFNSMISNKAGEFVIAGHVFIAPDFGTSLMGDQIKAIADYGGRISIIPLKGFAATSTFYIFTTRYEAKSKTGESTTPIETEYVWIPPTTGRETLFVDSRAVREFGYIYSSSKARSFSGADNPSFLAGIQSVYSDLHSVKEIIKTRKVGNGD